MLSVCFAGALFKIWFIISIKGSAYSDLAVMIVLCKGLLVPKLSYYHFCCMRKACWLECGILLISYNDMTDLLYLHF